MRYIFAGSRSWPLRSYRTIENIVKLLPNGSIVAHGGEAGADLIFDGFARQYGYTIEYFLAEWDKYGNQAGRIRNMQMIDIFKPDVVIIFLVIGYKTLKPRQVLDYALYKGHKVVIFTDQNKFYIANMHIDDDAKAIKARTN